MLRCLRRWSVRLALAAVAIPILLVGVYGFYLADAAGVLPWQADPTRIPITPFADIPGYSVPAIATETPPPVETSASQPAAPTAEIVSRIAPGAGLPVIASQAGLARSATAVGTG